MAWTTLAVWIRVAPHPVPGRGSHTGLNEIGTHDRATGRTEDGIGSPPQAEAMRYGSAPMRCAGGAPSRTEQL